MTLTTFSVELAYYLLYFTTHLPFLLSTVFKIDQSKSLFTSRLVCHIPYTAIYSISVPSRNTVTTTPFSYTLIQSTVRSIKSIPSSPIGFSTFVISIKSIARNFANKSSPCVFLSHSGTSISRHSNNRFHAIR